eukprot:scaffold63733_cov69-Phaeocystis_antarctica.AAC.1
MRTRADGSAEVSNCPNLRATTLRDRSWHPARLTYTSSLHPVVVRYCSSPVAVSDFGRERA